MELGASTADRLELTGNKAKKTGASDILGPQIEDRRNTSFCRDSNLNLNELIFRFSGAMATLAVAMFDQRNRLFPSTHPTLPIKHGPKKLNVDKY